MPFKTCSKLLIAIGEVLDVSPAAERLSSAYAALDLRPVGKVRVIQVAVVAQQEGGKVQGEVRF